MALIRSRLLVYVLTMMQLLVRAESTWSNSTAQFGQYGAGVSGCQVVPGMQAAVQCAATCDDDCLGFSFHNQVCKACSDGQSVSALTFSGEQFFFRRSQSVLSRVVVDLELADRMINLTRPLTSGTLIYLSVTLHAERFQLDLETNQPSTTALHIYVRLMQGRVVLNTWTSGIWGKEINIIPADPFAVGRRTDVYIVTTQDRFMIYFDKDFVVEYLYRLPLSDVTTLAVSGFGEVHELSV